MQECNVVNLGLTDYNEALNFQRELFKKRHTGQIGDTLILTEHLPVYTCGRSADAKSLIIKKLPGDSELITVDRGGSITFHGPGQLMIYPIISLAKRMKAISYLRSLEQMIISSMAVYGIKTAADEITGIWVGNRKLASVGIKISSGTTMHGAALNVNCDLSCFEPILACGGKAKAVSMKDLLGYEVDMEDVTDLVMLNFGKVFNYRIKEAVNEF